jgi:hypothetical protein
MSANEEQATAVEASVAVTVDVKEQTGEQAKDAVADEPQAVAKEPKAALAEPLRVPVCVLHKSTILRFQVPIDEEFKDCRRQVAETRAEEAAEHAKARTAADEALEESAGPFSDAVAAAVEDCEQFVALLRARGADADLSALARLSALVGAHYTEWAAQQQPPAPGGASPEIDESKAPLYVVRYARPWDAVANQSGAWGAAHVLDLNKNDLEKLFAESDVEAFRAFKMHKRSPRVLLLERAFETPDGLATLSFALVFAVRGDLRAEILARGGQAAADQSQEPAAAVPSGATAQELDDTAALRTFIKCTMTFNGATYKNKATADKVSALRQERFGQGIRLYEQRRLRKRNDRFAAQIPALVACATALMARELASLYDPDGVKVPSEAVIIEVQCHDGLIVLEESALISHSHLRKVLGATVEKMQAIEKRIVGERPAPDQPGPHEQELRFQFKSLVDEYNKLTEIDQIALTSNTRNEVVFSIIDTASGLDAQNIIGTRFLRRINVRDLLKFTKLTAEKTTAAAAPAAEVPVPAPAAEVPVPAQAAEVPVPAPAAEVPVAAPAAEVPVAAPVAEVPVPAPAAETPVAAPTSATADQ